MYVLNAVNALYKSLKCNQSSSGMIEAETSRPSRGRAKNKDSEPRPRHLAGYRDKTEAAGCRGRAEVKTGKNMPRGTAAASSTTSLVTAGRIASVRRGFQFLFDVG